MIYWQIDMEIFHRLSGRMPYWFFVSHKVLGYFVVVVVAAGLEC